MLEHSRIRAILAAFVADKLAKQYDRATWSEQGEHLREQVRELCPLSEQREHVIFLFNGL
jgi:hypothetical protein